ncbi:MAG: ChaN family lipoprotein [Gammaproteobacteria bacterium]
MFMFAGCMEKAIQIPSDRILDEDHPLVGKIWDVNQAVFIDQEQLQSQILKSRYLLLGETHDNISHHEHQAEIIASLKNSESTASIHFEMIDDRQYETAGLAKAGSVDELMAKLKQTESGWQYEQMYAVVFEQVLQAGYELLPANVSHGVIRKIIKQGEKQVPEDITKLLTDVSLSSDQRLELEQEVISGHCNALPAKMISPMILAQRVRDAMMSLSLLRSDKEHRVLIAGSGHVRNDRGVPIYLAARDPKASIITIGFTEVIEDNYHVDGYTERWGTASMPFDYVWFTPRFNRDDPCEQFSRMLKMRGGAPE